MSNFPMWPDHRDRGRLLFRISAENRAYRYIGLVATLVYAFAFAWDVSHHGWRSGWGNYLFVTVYALALFFARWVKFYENGIYFPEDSHGGRGRFIRWAQVARYHWDGDVLTIIRDDSVLAGGAIAGYSLAGGAVRVPQSRRAEIESLLANRAT